MREALHCHCRNGKQPVHSYGESFIRIRFFSMSAPQKHSGGRSGHRGEDVDCVLVPPSDAKLLGESQASVLSGFVFG